MGKGEFLSSPTPSTISRNLNLKNAASEGSEGNGECVFANYEKRPRSCCLCVLFSKQGILFNSFHVNRLNLLHSFKEKTVTCSSLPLSPRMSPPARQAALGTQWNRGTRGSREISRTLPPTGEKGRQTGPQTDPRGPIGS